MKNRIVNRIPASAFQPLNEQVIGKQWDNSRIGELNRAAAQAAKDVHEAVMEQQQHERQVEEHQQYLQRVQIQTNTVPQMTIKHVYLVEREDIARHDEIEGRRNIVGCFTTTEAAVKCAKSVIHHLDKDNNVGFPAEILEDKKATFYASTI